MLAKAEKKAAVRALKERPCADCGQRFPYYVMDFDHVRGEKREGVGKMLALGYALATIMEEIAKCDLVCANCHRERTFTRDGDVI